MASDNHTWSFSIIGGVKRVNLESGNDLVHLQELDPKLWTALSCPVDDLEIDSKTLELVDTDKDGQIRVPEVISAVNWLISIVNSPDKILEQSGEFPLSVINTNTEQGKMLYDSAVTILKNLGKEGTATLTVADTSDRVKIFAGTRFNGDGVITEDTVAADEEVVTLLKEIMQFGSVADRNGKEGITLEILQSFLEQGARYASWQQKKELGAASIFPLGKDTIAAYDNYKAIKAKLDDYFMRCRMAAFDPSSANTLNLQTARVEAISAKDLSACIDEIATYPISAIRADGTLSLSSGINPAWEDKVQAFKALTVKWIFPDKDSISEKEWHKIASVFAPFEAWNSEKEGEIVESLGLARIQEILAGNASGKLMKLIAQDRAVESEATNIILVDKLVRYYRDLFTLLKNFVTFYDFYTPGSKGVFQAGTLYIDQRSADLCIKVTDMGRQDLLASYSGLYLLYCDCVSRSTSAKMTIVAAVTNGDIDDLMVGRNALFYDRDGLDWDATIVKIKENPISIRQAFFAPYRRMMQFVEKQINKAAEDHDEKVTENLKKSAEEMDSAAPPEKATVQEQAFDVAKFAGIFAAIGLALGAIGSVMVAVTTGFMKLRWWEMPFAIIAVLLIISGPSMIIAFLKLRKRNLAPLLEANGWAINSRVKINIKFGRTLTHLATLPKGARVNLNDPFREKKNPFIPILIVALVIAGVILVYMGKHGMLHL